MKVCHMTIRNNTSLHTLGIDMFRPCMPIIIMERHCSESPRLSSAFLLGGSKVILRIIARKARTESLETMVNKCTLA